MIVHIWVKRRQYILCREVGGGLQHGIDGDSENEGICDGYKWSDESGDVARQVPDRLDVIARYVEWVGQWELKNRINGNLRRC